MGRYKLNVNVSLTIADNTSRKAPEIYLTINGTRLGSYASTGYIRRNNGHEESSLHLNEIIELTPGDILSIEIVRTANNNSIVMRSVGSSNIYLEKIN